MPQVELHEAAAQLPQLVERAEAGEDIVIARDGKPIVRLIRVTGFAAIRGAFRGQVQIADDFDELPDDIADAFGAR